MKKLGLFWLAACLALGLCPARAVDNGLGQKPYLGWSSWSLEATKFPGYGGGDHWADWLTAAHVEAQSDALHQTLQKHGYTYVNMDSGWMGGYDAYGRPSPDPKKFPGGIVAVAQHVHRNGQKLGIYWVPGIHEDLYKINSPILGTPYHVQDIVFKPKRPATGWGFGYKIDYAQPCAQAYINSVAAQFASWGVDLLKFDGVTPGSGHNDLSIDARPDVAAWGAALKATRRPIWLILSWNLDHDYRDYWRQYANSWRITDDVETYGPTLVGWDQVARRFDAARAWQANAGPGKGWNDLDSLDIGNGAMDGLTVDERQTYMTLWVIECAPLYSGDDLTKMDANGLRLLTNDEVLAVDQAGQIAEPVVWGGTQVWRAKNANGSVVVALFNLDGKSSADVAATWEDLGLTGPAHVRDLWSHANLGVFNDQFHATLAPHACRLLKITKGKAP